MKKFKYFIIGLGVFFLMLCSSILIFNKASYAISLDEQIDLQRKAVVEVANAFYKKGINIQYDTYKRWFNFAPEDATDDSTVFSVCSIFVQAVYYHALGIDVPNYTEWLHSYAKDKNNSDFVVKYYTEEEYVDLKTNKKDKFLKDLLDVIKPGDILTIAGHTQLVVSVSSNEAYILESIGKNGNRDDGVGVDSYEVNGAIKKSKFTTEVLNGRNGDFSIVRPISNGEYFLTRTGEKQNIKITNSALTRLKYGGIDIDKTGSNGTNSYVDFNDEIEYNIKITNNSSSKYEELTVVENITDLVEVVDNGNGIYNNGMLKWNNISIDAGKTVTIKYKVKVKEKKENYNKEIVSVGYVGDIKTATVTNTIGYVLNKEEQDKVVKTLNDLKDTSKKSGLAFVNEVYKNAFDVDLKISDLKIYDFITDKSLATLNNDLKKYVFLNAYNTYNNSYWFRKGKTFRDGTDRDISYFFDVDYWNSNYSQYIKTINHNSFKVGDIILSYDNKLETVWICMGENKFMKITSSSKKIITDKTQLIKEFSEIFYSESFIALNSALLLRNNYNDNVIEEKSSNNYLSELKLNVGNINFDKNVFDYNVKILDDIDKINISVKTEDNTAKYDIIGNQGLVNGSVIKIVVTAENGSKNEYRLNIIKDNKNISQDTNIDEGTDIDNPQTGGSIRDFVIFLVIFLSGGLIIYYRKQLD